jgi:hypothetical protein
VAELVGEQASERAEQLEADPRLTERAGEGAELVD